MYLHCSHTEKDVMKTFLMSTLALAAMTGVAMADASQPADSRLLLSDAQMDQLTAGKWKKKRFVFVFRQNNDFTQNCYDYSQCLQINVVSQTGRAVVRLGDINLNQ